MRSRFARDGAVRLSGLGLSDELLDGAAAATASLLGGETNQKTGVRAFEDRVMDAWRVSDAVRALALAPSVLAAVEEVSGHRPRAFQTLGFIHGTEQRPHADSFHFDSDPPGRLVGVWVALEDVDADNGPVVYYRGTHRMAEFRARHVEDATAAEREPRYLDHVATLLHDHRCEPEEATMGRGEALAWAGDLVHGGALRRDPLQTRRSQVTHYYAGDCRTWSPKLSTSSRRHWTELAWIS